MEWKRVTDQDEAASLFPAWLGRRLVGLHGRFGLLLVTGDVMRITSIGAVHMSSDGMVLLDVSLDDAGVPEGSGQQWLHQREFLIRQVTCVAPADHRIFLAIGLVPRHGESLVLLQS